MSKGIVLVTGASHGIGYATAEHLAKNGYTVYASCRDKKSATELQELAKRIPQIKVITLDVTSQLSVNKAVKKIMRKEGKIDVVINNAGIGIYGPTETHTILEAKSVFNTNYLGILRVNRAVLPIMRKQNYGKIVNLSSVSGVIPSKNMPVYSASKAAVEHTTAADAYHLLKWNIRLFLIQPGPVVTNFEQRTPFGTHFKDVHQNPYLKTMCQDRIAWNEMMEGGQSAEEVAGVIKRVIESITYQLWHQTSLSVSTQLGKHYKDLTGNQRIPPHAKL